LPSQHTHDATPNVGVSSTEIWKRHRFERLDIAIFSLANSESGPSTCYAYRVAWVAVIQSQPGRAGKSRSGSQRERFKVGITAGDGHGGLISA
jgi:hypothetical protein